MKIIDTHAHLQSKEFNDNIELVLSRLGIVEKVFLATSNEPDIEKAKQYCELYANLYYFAGIHPHHASQYNTHTIDAIEYHLKNPKCIGIGEIGLDYYYEYSNRNIQKEVFSTLLDLAIEHECFVSIHIRDAIKDAIDILRSKKGLKAIIHCFSGDLDLLKFSLDRNFFLGIGGIVTFKNSLIRQNVSQIPLDNMVLETDAPYLAPHPKRGKINEPAYLVYILEEIAALLGIKQELVAKYTYENSLKILL